MFQPEHAAERTIVGERDVGVTRFDFVALYLRWFVYWLKGIDNGVTNMPKVQIYVGGRHEWRVENKWLLARAGFTEYYLHSDGHANSRFGTGMLRTLKPADEPPDHFGWDPKNPVPRSG